jgi:hypothetical protein
MNELRLATFGCAGLLVLLVACGDDTTDTSSSTSSTGGGGTGGSTSEGGAGGSGGAMSTFEGLVFDGITSAPLPGAGVAIDLEDGTRLEAISDAAGKVSIEYPAGAEWETAITHKNGYNFAFYAGGMFAQPLEMYINPDVDTSGYVKISGTATNMNDPVNDFLTVLVSPETPPSFVFEEQGVTTYELLVPPSTDFTLGFLDIRRTVSGRDLSRVFHSVIYTEETGISADTVFDIDFSNGQAATGAFALSVAVPADATLAASGVALVNVGSSRGFSGGSTACVHDAANGEFDCSGSLYDNGATPSRTSYLFADAALLDREPARFVQASSPGGPPSGLVDPDFPNPPTITSPSGAGPHPVDAPIAYTVASGGGNSDFTLYNLSTPTGRLVGFGFMPPGGITVPALPTGSDASTHFESEMRGALFTCRVSAGQCAAAGVQEWAAAPPN